MQKLGIRLASKWTNDATRDLEEWQIRTCDKAEKLLSDNPSNISVADFPVVYAYERAQFKKQDGKDAPLNG